MQSFTLRAHMLDPVEQSLYRALILVLCQRALLFVKVNVCDLFTRSPYATANNELAQLAHYQADFVLCDRETMRPLAVILVEGEETSGQEGAAELCVQICIAAGLPVIRLPRQNSYLLPSLTALIEPLLTGSLSEDAVSGADRSRDMADATVTRPLNRVRQPRKLYKRPAYPGYGALRAIANKLS